jgi:hypothetical protein
LKMLAKAESMGRNEKLKTWNLELRSALTSMF